MLKSLLNKKNLLNNKTYTGLAVAGLAAFAYYRYSRMTEEEKSKFVDTITSAGKNFFGQFMKHQSPNAAFTMADNIAGTPNYAGSAL